MTFLREETAPQRRWIMLSTLRESSCAVLHRCCGHIARIVSKPRETLVAVIYDCRSWRSCHGLCCFAANKRFFFFQKKHRFAFSPCSIELIPFFTRLLMVQCVVCSFVNEHRGLLVLTNMLQDEVRVLSLLMVDRLRCHEDVLDQHEYFYEQVSTRLGSRCHEAVVLAIFEVSFCVVTWHDV